MNQCGTTTFLTITFNALEYALFLPIAFGLYGFVLQQQSPDYRKNREIAP